MEAGKALMTMEVRESGAVTWHTYVTYARAAGGVWLGICLILLFGTGAFFARSLIAPTETVETLDLAIHGTVLLVLAVATASVWSRQALGTVCLRRLELTAFGAMVVFFGYLQYRDFASHALLTGVAETSVPRIFHLGAMAIAMRWFLVIVLYGAFIPNTWRRSLAVVSV